MSPLLECSSLRGISTHPNAGVKPGAALKFFPIANEFRPFLTRRDFLRQGAQAMAAMVDSDCAENAGFMGPIADETASRREFLRDVFLDRVADQSALEY